LAGDVVEMLDGIVDMIYTYGGSLVEFGCYMSNPKVYELRYKQDLLTYEALKYIWTDEFCGVDSVDLALMVNECFMEVHRSNMTKFFPFREGVRSSDEGYKIYKSGWTNLYSLRDNEGKVRKPSTYEPPQLKPILVKYGVIK
jgi:predicted HAD superfamily Cof-like phosphohydrolase